jgi:hypothetical protein
MKTTLASKKSLEFSESGYLLFFIFLLLAQNAGESDYQTGIITKWTSSR